MKKNLGKTDRILRAVLGCVLVIVGYYYNSWLVLTGGIIFITSVFSWCPIYAPFGWSTHDKSKQAT
jgi:hypothetical protein